MDANERNAKVDELLHDAEHADGGADFAAMMGDAASVASLRAKCARLVAEVLAIDPQRLAPAWKETSLRVP